MARMSNRGFTYEVTDEQIQRHRARSTKDILIWLEETAKFIWMIQTPEERERMKRAKDMEW
jgi:hypothetical protein